ncbi:tumor necrosis factor receptor superfamily member 6 [Mantella aurantiaca]
MVSLHLIFIMVILGSNLVLPMKFLQRTPDKLVKKNDGSRLFKRQLKCLDGEYPGETHCCKNCGKGTYAASECKESSGEPTCKPCTNGVDFMDKENGYIECQICQHCESASGQETLHSCTLSQNTVCKCKDEFFCFDKLSSPDENCNQCHHCTICDNGVAEPCTSTKDTVCQSHARLHTILWPVFICFIIAAIIFSVYVYRKRKMKNEASESVGPLIDPTPPCPTHLENIELDNHLYDISGIMEYDPVLQLVMKQITLADREVIKLNNPNNAREEKYELLKKWYIEYGRQGAFKILLQNCRKVEAEKILELFKPQNVEP